MSIMTTVNGEQRNGTLTGHAPSFWERRRRVILAWHHNIAETPEPAFKTQLAPNVSLCPLRSLGEAASSGEGIQHPQTACSRPPSRMQGGGCSESLTKSRRALSTALRATRYSGASQDLDTATSLNPSNNSFVQQKRQTAGSSRIG